MSDEYVFFTLFSNRYYSELPYAMGLQTFQLSGKESYLGHVYIQLFLEPGMSVQRTSEAISNYQSRV